MESTFTRSSDKARARFPRNSIGALAAVSLVLVATPAAAQDNFPVKPIQFIVPTGPGGGTDTVARVIAKNLSERLKWQVVVINRLGAGTRLASESVAKLHRETSALLRDPQIAKLLTADGGEAVGSSPEEFAAFIKADIDKWTRLGRTIQIRQE